MTSTRIGYAKREIRVLGLAAKRVNDSSTVVGALTRGAERLEAVMQTSTPSIDLTEAAAEMIHGSPHMGQVRAIIIDSTAAVPCTINAEALWRSLNKPVIELNSTEPAAAAWRQLPFMPHGLTNWSARRVLEASANAQKVEAIRLASMIIIALATPEG